MKLYPTRYGYVCASDERLQFRRLRSGWEVRIGAQQARPQFATLAQAKIWARPHWRPNFLYPPKHCVGRDLLHAALLGDELAFYAYLDYLEETQERFSSKRHIYISNARWFGLIGKEGKKGKK